MITPTIFVWQWDLDHPHLADASVLSQEERIRAARFIVPNAGRRFIAGRAALRQTLASFCDSAAADLVIWTGPNGKPFLRDGPHFNIAHSGPMALFAVADFAVGIDVEAVRPIEPGVANSVFTPPELSYLAQLPRAQAEAAFFRGWTRKEAVIKAKGGSIVDLQTFAVLPTARLPGWQVTDLAMPPGYTAAVAAGHRDWTVIRHAAGVVPG